MSRTKRIILLTIVAALLFACSFPVSAAEITPDGITCCDNMRKVTKYSSQYHRDGGYHHYYCDIHETEEYCQLTNYYYIYTTWCTNCGTDWGNETRLDHVTHSGCQ